ncbi:MAG: hydroxymethylbilane synthase [Planctomycetes bacterium]|nr:hydroxymethylbilane synthase [Planctomycetota bacterium]
MNDATPIRLGTRGSELALWQAETVRDLLSREAPMYEVEIVKVKTIGDRIQDVKIEQIGRTAVFTAELDAALLAGEVDLAVHSLKDVETAELPGMTLKAVLPRGPVEDVLVAPVPFAELKTGARVGTGSVRRVAQLQRLRPDLEIVPVRGNVPTRVAKVDRGELDGLIMARAGLVRLGLAHRIAHVFPPLELKPAVGQGAVCVTVRSDDERMNRIVGALNHEPTWNVVSAERACLRRLGGGCNVPLGVSFTLKDGHYDLQAAVFSLDGMEMVDVALTEPDDADPAAVGNRVAEALLARGAGHILAAIKPRERD